MWHLVLCLATLLFHASGEPSIIDIPALGGDASHLQTSDTNKNLSPSIPLTLTLTLIPLWWPWSHIVTTMDHKSRLECSIICPDGEELEPTTQHRFALEQMTYLFYEMSSIMQQESLILVQFLLPLGLGLGMRPRLPPLLRLSLTLRHQSLIRSCNFQNISESNLHTSVLIMELYWTFLIQYSHC